MKRLKRIIAWLLTLFLLGTCVFLYARHVEPRLLATTMHTITVPESVTECNIVFFADTHFGKLYSPDNLSRIVEKISEQKPDLVVFGGDFMDNYARDRSLLDLDDLRDGLAEIDAPYGKFAVYGNHDYGGGAVRVYEDLMANSGFTVMKNDRMQITALGFELISFDDALLGYTDPSLYELENDQFSLIVSHEPDIADHLTLAQPGLMLSGHSHGGQVSLPYLTERVLPPGAQLYVKGLYENRGVNGNLSLFVTKGIGMTMLPYRFGNIPEIVVLSLRHSFYSE